MAPAVNPEEIVLLLADEYSRMAAAYDANVTPHFAPIAERVVGLADPRSGELFLDLGAGTALLACMIAPKVLPQGVVAIDLADGALAAGTYRAARLGIKSIRFEMMDVRNIIYPGRRFDAVVSNLGIPAFGFDRCFVEVARVLKSIGRFIFSEWGDFADPPYDALLRAVQRHRNPNPPKKLADLRAAVAFYRRSDAMKAIRSPDRMKTSLKAAGFRHVDVKTELHKAVFAPPETFIDFRMAWGANEAEFAGMAEPSRAAFLAEVKDELWRHASGDRLEVDWLVHHYVAKLA